jgi:hypothetical protein
VLDVSITEVLYLPEQSLLLILHLTQLLGLTVFILSFEVMSESLLLALLLLSLQCLVLPVELLQLLQVLRIVSLVVVSSLAVVLELLLLVLDKLSEAGVLIVGHVLSGRDVIPVNTVVVIMHWINVYLESQLILGGSYPPRQ